MDSLEEKALGLPIGGVSGVDGDGDGFRTGPSGEDNVPAPTKTFTKRAKDITQQLASFFGKDKEAFDSSDGGVEYRRRVQNVQNGVTPDIQLEIIAEKQGFTGLPKVVSSGEMDRLEKQGWTIAYRGINTTTIDMPNGEEVTLDAKELAEQFRTGKYFAGLGAHGNGIHFALDRESAEVYAEGMFGEKGEVIKVAIPPDALIGLEEMKKEVEDHRRRIKEKRTNFYGDDDLGRAMVAKGARGARLNLLVSGGWVAEPNQGNAKPNVVVIYDRSMLAVEKSS